MIAPPQLDERSTDQSPSLRHVPALDGLRGLAVAAVLLFHGGHLRGGYLGVDLFFVLSGFLITSLLLAEVHRSRRVDLPHFWARRARRLLPALFCVLVGVAVYAAVAAAPAELARIRYDGIATLLYVANWRAVFAKLSYWDLFSSPSPLAHTWSLAIEEQFYLVWPLVVAALAALRARANRARRDVATTVFWVAAALAVASTVLMAVLYRPGLTDRVYYGSDTRAGSILVGAALAAWLARSRPARRRRTRRSRRWLEVTGLAGLSLIAVAWTQLQGQSAILYRGGFLVCALAAAAVIAAVTHPQSGPIARALSVRPLVALGLVSYGVYLWHWPVFVYMTASRTGLHGWTLFGAQVATTLAIAVVSYFAIEQPIRHGAGAPLTVRRLTPVVAVTMVLALFATTGGISPPATLVAAPDPLPPRTTLVTPATLTVAQVSPASAAPVPRTLLVVGNSVAWYLGDAFKTIAADPPLTVVNRALPACTYPAGVTRVRNHEKAVWPHPIIDCTATWANDVDVVRPDVVLFVLGDFGDGEVEHDGSWIHPCTPEFDDWYRDQLQQAMTVLGAYGARVALATAAYLEFPHFPELETQDDCVNSITREVALSAPSGILVDLGYYVCPTNTCRTEQDGVTLRSDGLHYRDESARLIATWMLPQLRAPRGTSEGE